MAPPSPISRAKIAPPRPLPPPGARPRPPPRSTRLVANHPLGPPLSDLSAEALDTFQAVYNLRGVGPVLDTSEATDLETCTDLLYLLQNDYIATE